VCFQPREETTDHGGSHKASEASIAAEEGILAFCGDQMGSGDTSTEQQKAQVRRFPLVFVCLWCAFSCCFFHVRSSFGQHDVIGSTW